MSSLLSNPVFLVWFCVDPTANDNFSLWVKGLNTKTIHDKKSPLYAVDLQSSTKQNGKFYYSIALHYETQEPPENPADVLQISTKWKEELEKGLVQTIVS
jgi:hypothetical protein